MLKDLRKKVARQHDLPPFVIFQDPSLEDMAIQYPITIEEMQNISGVGVGKARKFGEEFIRLIRTYVEEKEIVRPQDMIVKSVGNKSGNKIFIIQGHRPQDGFRGYRPGQRPRFRRIADRDRRDCQFGNETGYFPTTSNR